jgi:hypothetical protein
MSWYSNQNELLELADWLNGAVGAFLEPADVISFFRQPWKWDNEHDAFNLWKSLPTGAELARVRVVLAASNRSKIDSDFIREVEDLIPLDLGRPSSFTESCIRLVLGHLPIPERNKNQ